MQQGPRSCAEKAMAMSATLQRCQVAQFSSAALCNTPCGTARRPQCMLSSLAAQKESPRLATRRYSKQDRQDVRVNALLCSRSTVPFGFERLPEAWATSSSDRLRRVTKYNSVRVRASADGNEGDLERKVSLKSRNSSSSCWISYATTALCCILSKPIGLFAKVVDDSGDTELTIEVISCYL